MRYRIKDYSVSIYYDQSTSERKGVRLTISIPSEVYAEMSQSLSIPRTREAIRLIADETRGGYILCSTGQKVLSNAGISSLSTNQMQLMFDFADLITAANGDTDDIAAINAIAATDEFTIEMDWGESIDDVPSPDLSTVAKESQVKDGNDTAVSVGKEVRSEVGTGSDTAAESGTLFAVVKWVKDKVKSIYNLIGTPATGQPSTLFAAIAAGGGGGDAQESTSQEILSRIGSAGSGQSATLFGAVGDIALSATTLQSLADSWAAMVTNRNSLAGWTFPSGIAIDSAGQLLSYVNQVVSIDDSSITFLADWVLSNCNNLISVNLPNLESVGQNIFLNIPYVEELSLPKLTTKGNSSFYNMAALRILRLPSLTSNTQHQFSYMPNLVELDITKMTVVSVGMAGTLNLIKVICGWSGVNTNMALTAWSPTNALSDTSTSLIEQGESFASNLEKLLYNIRTYIAANLPDRTGLSSLTFSFSAAVKAAINADAATAAAFTNKNWTIA